ncbi:MAG: DUF3276 family protein [bacterium]
MEKYNNELIYENRVKAGKRTYFFDVKKTNEGFPYLEITESRKQEDGRFLRTNIMLFHEDIGNFKDELGFVFDSYFRDLPIERRERYDSDLA